MDARGVARLGIVVERITAYFMTCEEYLSTDDVLGLWAIGSAITHCTIQVKLPLSELFYCSTSARDSGGCFVLHREGWNNKL